MSDGWERVGKPRAISRQVWEARGYERWTTDDISPVERAFADLPTKRQRSKVEGWARKTSGVLIPRYAPPGLDLPHVYPELRPDNKIVSGAPWTEKHRHDFEGELPGWRRDYRHFTVSEARLHIVRKHAGLTPADVSNEEIRTMTIRELRKLNRRGEHGHKSDPTQYLFAPGKDEYGHDTACRIDIPKLLPG